ncbi:hypothetical protein EDD58_101331 [Hazenella coriacea]|uniref:Uncharacterized protein n=1 Tax=Hazenella coriacea TaxID=1179467 RepID=A0A4R3LEC8_9BACL|nr:hypothetical protein EDD58_101331 [Hazenella coriacea]
MDHHRYSCDSVPLVYLFLWLWGLQIRRLLLVRVDFKQSELKKTRPAILQGMQAFFYPLYCDSSKN